MMMLFPCGVSTMTVVALTTATATEPSSRPSSRTASLLISDTTRKRPALQLDLGHHLVRGDPGDQPDEPVAGRAAHLGGVGGQLGLSAGELGQLQAVHGQPAGVVLDRGQIPFSIQRRTVSSLTPRKRAASDTRIFGMTPIISYLRKIWAPYPQISKQTLPWVHPRSARPVEHRHGASQSFCSRLFTRSLDFGADPDHNRR